MTMITYAKGERYRILRDTRTHCGFIEHIKSGAYTPWFVCIEGAEQLKTLRHVRYHNGKSSFDNACYNAGFKDGMTVFNREGEDGHVKNGNWVREV